MTLTAEQKRLARKRKKEEEKIATTIIGTEMVKAAPPMNKMKPPMKAKNLGKRADYGGHQKALNFPMPQSATESDSTNIHLTMNGPWVEDDPPTTNQNKIGSLPLGLVYEGDWKAKSKLAGNGERDRCLISEEYLQFLLLAKKMLLPILHPTLQPIVDETMRLTILRGARTLAHTDSFRGNTHNYLYILKEEGVEPGHLCYDTFSVFKYSVVKLFGKLFIPHSYSEASNECKLIGEHPTRPNYPHFYIFSASVIDSMVPFGNLDFGVVGWTSNKGSIQVVPGYADVCVYKAPLYFCEMSWQQIVDVA